MIKHWKNNIFCTYLWNTDEFDDFCRTSFRLVVVTSGFLSQLIWLNINKCAYLVFFIWDIIKSLLLLLLMLLLLLLLHESTMEEHIHWGWWICILSLFLFFLYVLNYDVKLFEDKRDKLVVDESAYLVYLQIFEDLHVTYDGPNKLNAIRSHLGGVLGMLRWLVSLNSNLNLKTS